jgi:hypothetical protein
VTDDPFKPRVSGGGSFFKPAEYTDALAIVFEFKKVLKDQPHEYEGVKSVRDEAIADIAVFKNSEDVENATPSHVEQGVKLTNTVLVADVERNDWVGEATVQVIRKAKRAYVYRDPEFPGAREAAVKWYLARQAAEADVDVPNFDED